MTKQKLDSQKHKQFLVRLLIDIFKELHGKIGFKGGTCAYLFYDLPRISLDLDFDILEPLHREDTDNLKKIFTKYTKIKEFYEKRWTTFFLLDYQPYTPNIKIELNKRKWTQARYKPVWLMGVEMQIVDKPTLVAGKLLALGTRRQPMSRDLFDTCYFLKSGFPINKEFVKEVADKTLSAYLKFLLSYIDKNFRQRNVLQGLGQVLDVKQKEWVKQDLIAETKKEIKKRLELSDNIC